MFSQVCEVWRLWPWWENEGFISLVAWGPLGAHSCPLLMWSLSAGGFPDYHRREEVDWTWSEVQSHSGENHFCPLSRTQPDSPSLTTRKLGNDVYLKANLHSWSHCCFCWCDHVRDIIKGYHRGRLRTVAGHFTQTPTLYIIFLFCFYAFFFSASNIALNTTLKHL